MVSKFDNLNLLTEEQRNLVHEKTINALIKTVHELEKQHKKA